MPSAVVTTRLHPKLKASLEEFWRHQGENPSAGLRHIAEEWWTLQHLPHIHFRDGVSGRRAALRHGPDVWELVMVARDYGFDPTTLPEDPWLESASDSSGTKWDFDLPSDIADRLSDHFGGAVGRQDIRQGLLYAALFPDAVSEGIEANDRAARALSRALSRALAAR